ncbi:MAG: penicillin-binding protein 2, partial [Desulfatitalea sp.]|nr:penicillin-binding protein 2 [Desulfatitalea sp.]NNK01072.1 penicillin-binding protein 2 [Desulfatitalea sp.]
QSCDVFFYQVGESLGVDRLANYARAMGLGAPTQLNLDQESHGLIPTTHWKRKRFNEPWQGGETLNIAIGQGYNLVTPIQMAVLAAAVGNGGILYCPYLIESVQTVDGRITFSGGGKVANRLTIQPETLAQVHQGLWEVVNSPKGTAFQSRFSGVEFSGKTGTAQVVGRARENEENGEAQREAPKDHAWFVAYAPSESPEIAVAVIIEHGEHGSSAAAPVAREVIRTYLGLPEDHMTKAVDKALATRLGAMPEGPAEMLGESRE